MVLCRFNLYVLLAFRIKARSALIKLVKGTLKRKNAMSPQNSTSPSCSHSPQDLSNDLNTLAGLISPVRDTANGYHLIARKYQSGDAECTAIRLMSGDSLKRGGGAKRKNEDRNEMDPATIAASARRAKTKCRMKALSFCPDKLLTLTFRCDENHRNPAGINTADLGECWKVFKYFSKLTRAFYKDKWIYIAVPELTKEGNIHFHLAIKGFYSYNILRHFWYRATGTKKVLGEDGKRVWPKETTGGQINVSEAYKTIGKHNWNPRRISQYLVKYITKSDISGFNKSRYSSGGDIVIPEPMIGWVALGIEPIRFLWEVVTSLSRRQPEDTYEVDAYFHITYLST